MLRIRKSRLVIGLAASMLGALPCPAQSVRGLSIPSAEAAPAPRPAPTPDAILEISDIHARALLLQTRLRAIRSEARPRDAVVRVEQGLKEFRERLERERESLSIAAGPEITSAQLEFIEQTWLDVLSTTQGWDGLLTRRSDELQKMTTELRADSALWRRTRDAERDDVLTPVQVDRINATLAAIAETEKQVVDRRDHVWRLADQTLEIQLAARDAIDGVREIRERQQVELTATHVPPLWIALSDDLGQGGFLLEAGSAVQGQWTKIRMALQQYSGRLRWHGVLLFALIVGFEWLRRRSRRWDREDPALAATLMVFEHPIASATVIALLLSWLLYPLAPSSMFAVTGVLALMATLTILPGLLPFGLRSYSYVLAGLYFATQLVMVARPAGDFERVMVLVVGLVAAGVLGRVLFLTRSGRFTDLTGGWLLTFTGLLGLGTLVVGVAIGADVLGKARLGAFLAVATIRSAFIAIFLFVSMNVLGGLWVGLLRSPMVRGLRAVQVNREVLRESGLRWIRVGLVLLWLTLTLRLFEVATPLKDGLGEALSASLEIRNLHLSLGMVVSFAGVLWAAMLLSRFVRFFLDEDVLPRLSLSRGVPRAVSLTLHYVLLLFGFLAALAAAGVEFSQFTILGGAFGIGLAFGMQNIVNNFVSGLILLYERPIQVGDTIEMGSISGNVDRIGIRSSTVRTWDGAEVIVPNADLIAKEVTNWTLSDRHRRINVSVGVAYGTDPTTVLRLLEEVGARNEEILRSPPPSAVFVGFGESSLDFVLRVWTARFEEWVRIKSDLQVEISRAFADAGITIPFPQRDLHLVSVEPEAVVRSPAPPHGVA